ncbi:hypothetical protein Goari_011999, partial [Gossypium aridum]|nr:hypothetical protein [Gossypium aridum]
MLRHSAKGACLTIEMKSAFCGELLSFISYSLKVSIGVPSKRSSFLLLFKVLMHCFFIALLGLSLMSCSFKVREAKNEGARGGGRGGRGYGRGRGGSSGYRRDFANDENSFSNSAVPEDGESGKPSERRGYGGPRPYRGGRRGGFSNGEDADGEQPRRLYERRSGTGRGNELKREGSGRGNWGTQTDELAQVTEEVTNEGERNLGDEKPAGEEDAR